MPSLAAISKIDFPYIVEQQKVIEGARKLFAPSYSHVEVNCCYSNDISSVFCRNYVYLTIGVNRLIFANKTKNDIILALEFEKILGENFINILSGEITDEYAHGQIDEDFLKANMAGFDRQFYLCGPPPMMDAIEKQLENLGISSKAITTEKM